MGNIFQEKILVALFLQLILPKLKDTGFRNAVKNFLSRQDFVKQKFNFLTKLCQFCHFLTIHLRINVSVRLYFRVFNEWTFSLLLYVNKFQPLTVTSSRQYHVGVPLALIPNIHVFDALVESFSLPYDFQGSSHDDSARNAHLNSCCSPVPRNCWRGSTQDLHNLITSYFPGNQVQLQQKHLEILFRCQTWSRKIARPKIATNYVNDET